MKKLPLLLIFLAMISCIQRGKIYTGSIESGESDKLSEMALSVTAIPLETNSQCQLSDLQQIRYISSYIFIRSNNAIYRFTQSGRFINRIEIDPNVRLRRFTVNPDKQHLIVLDSLNAVHFYSFDGKKLFDVDATTGFPDTAILDIAYHNGYLWAVTEYLADNHAFEHWMFQLDHSFRPLAGQRLGSPDVGRFRLDGNVAPELYVTDNKVYVYSPITFRETVLADTLYLLASGQLDEHQLFPDISVGNPFPAYSLPVTLSGRYLIASYHDNVSERENFLLCYDRKTDKAFDLNGIQDDFYQTGTVKNLQPLEPDLSEYCFYKSGKEVTASFPERKAADNPVLFFVRLNS